MTERFVTHPELEDEIAKLRVLISQLQSGELLDGGVTLLAGAWPSAAPGATSGSPFVVKRAGTFALTCDCSAFQTTGAGASIQVDVYVDGVLVGSMFMGFNTTASVHMALNRFVDEIDLSAGTHYVYFRQVLGSSDSNDRGSITLQRIG